ncbi:MULTISPECIES: polysaccharide pyruvyl transferase family protein [unclassified Endozoicomonas]|uniref:polysaccharide pyruvyl transferase family protein n=1 Tax=unclassified Endozoicomonas TaxID=2644528 RepID=UPI003BAEAB01
MVFHNQKKSKETKSIKSQIREFILPPLMFTSWYFLKRKITPIKVDNCVKKLVFFSPHTSNPFGSKGDEAMLIALVNKLKVQNPDIELAIAVEPGAFVSPLKKLDVKPIECWSYPWSLKNIFAHVKDYDASICIGADVMDGYYSDIKSLRLWLISDLMARHGKKTIIGGFSFNSLPATFTKLFLTKFISDKIIVNLRDSCSLKRYDQIARFDAKLVADNAFMLAPTLSKEVSDIKKWVEIQKNNKRMVVIFNIHPILVPDRSKEKLTSMINSCAQTVDFIISEYNASVLFVAHDFRDKNTGDVFMLNEIYSKCKSDKSYLSTVFNDIPASDLKGLASLADLVITGRMHLSIAALGSGVPILGITYQDKFEGLIKHFELPSYVLASPEKIIDASFFKKFCEHGIHNVDELKKNVQSKVEVVSSLSEKNIRLI